MLYIRWSKNYHEMTKLGALPYVVIVNNDDKIKKLENYEKILYCVESLIIYLGGIFFYCVQSLIIYLGKKFLKTRFPCNR